MNDFDLRNDTRLLFRNDPTADLARLTAGKRVLFVYGGGSVKKNGCYEESNTPLRKAAEHCMKRAIPPASDQRSKPASTWRWRNRLS